MNFIDKWIIARIEASTTEAERAAILLFLEQIQIARVNLALKKIMG